MQLTGSRHAAWLPYTFARERDVVLGRHAARVASSDGARHHRLQRHVDIYDCLMYTCMTVSQVTTFARQRDVALLGGCDFL